jgi:hypothetical protein
MANLAAAVLVFEKRPRWEAELKRCLAGDALLVRPCRSVADLLALARAMPGSVAVIDFDGSEAVLRCLNESQAFRTGMQPVVILSQEWSELEWPLRELGAVVVFPETIQGAALAAVCRRLVQGDQGSGSLVPLECGTARPG